MATPPPRGRKPALPEPDPTPPVSGLESNYYLVAATAAVLFGAIGALAFADLGGAVIAAVAGAGLLGVLVAAFLVGKSTAAAYAKLQHHLDELNVGHLQAASKLHEGEGSKLFGTFRDSLGKLSVRLYYYAAHLKDPERVSLPSAGGPRDDLYQQLERLVKRHAKAESSVGSSREAAEHARMAIHGLLAPADEKGVLEALIDVGRKAFKPIYSVVYRIDSKDRLLVATPIANSNATGKQLHTGVRPVEELYLEKALKRNLHYQVDEPDEDQRARLAAPRESKLNTVWVFPLSSEVRAIGGWEIALPYEPDEYQLQTGKLMVELTLKRLKELENKRTFDQQVAQRQRALQQSLAVHDITVVLQPNGRVQQITFKGPFARLSADDWVGKPLPLALEPANELLTAIRQRKSWLHRLEVQLPNNEEQVAQLRLLRADVAGSGNPEPVLLGWAVESGSKQDLRKWQEQTDELRSSVRALEKTRRELLDLNRALSQSAVVFRADAANRITYVNDGLLSLTGRQRDETIGKGLPGLLAPDERGPSPAVKPLADGQLWRGDLIFPAKQRVEPIVLHLTVSPVMDENARCIGYTAIGFDVTEQRRKDTQLRSALAMSQQQEKELRTNADQLTEAYQQLQKSKAAVEAGEEASETLSALQAQYQALENTLNTELDRLAAEYEAVIAEQRQELSRLRNTTDA